MSDDRGAAGTGRPDRGEDPVAVRIRGIYTTALTRAFLAAGHDVVDASTPIRERFDAEFPDDDRDVDVTTTDDRQGVGVTGRPGAVATAVEVVRVARDALAWPAAAPVGSVFDARVGDTAGGGAICDLAVGAGPDGGADGGAGEGEGSGDSAAAGPAPEPRTRYAPGGTGDPDATVEGYLPFDDVDGYVDEGDDLRVQVRASAPPWSDRRPELSTTLRAGTGLASLVAGGSGVTVDAHDDEAARELAGMTDVLNVDVPDGWGIRWAGTASDAGLETLRTALRRAVDAAGALAPVRDHPVEPGRWLAAPAATAWVWFGRESRFALDDRRRAVTTTIPGHHRVKTAHEAASAGVDLAEALLADAGPDGAGGDGEDAADAFPFGVVADQFGPREGDTVRIDHGKPDGRAFTLGRAAVTDVDSDGSVTLRREMSPGGTYDALGVDREAGDVAVTTVKEGRWWYPTVYKTADGERKGTYVNVCTPVEAFPDAVRYVDLHVDVVKHADGTVERVDDDELDAAVAAGNVPEPLAEQARTVAASIERAL
jgi:hypothetical protein